MHVSALPPYVWPALLMSVLLLGVLGSAALLQNRGRSKRSSKPQSFVPYVEPRACAEACVAIVSGALLWIGYWDFIDSYLVPRQWWAKMCMALVGALGALATRSLYDQQLVHPDPDLGTSAALEDGVELPAALAAELSPRPRSLGMRAAASDGGANGEGEPSPRFGRTGRCCLCLYPPPFSASRCARALLATFSGLTMWVGLWDLIEDHVLPNAFSACAHEPSLGCAAVKLTLVAVGGVGLYLTRSLYGDHGSGPVHFQRL